jgi:hypothetical protein
LGFTVFAASASVLAMLWLLIVDRQQTARARARSHRAPSAPVVARPTRAVAYRRPGPLTQLKAIVGISAISVAIGAAIAFGTAFVVGISALLLRHALG